MLLDVDVVIKVVEVVEVVLAVVVEVVVLVVWTASDEGDATSAEDLADEEAAAALLDEPAAEFANAAVKEGIDTLPIASTSSSGSAHQLFKGCTFYLDRSTPLSLLSFLLRSYGCLATRLGWDPVLAPNSPLQEAAAAGLEQAKDRGYFKQEVAAYEERRKILMSAFDRLGLKYSRPEGSYFILLVRHSR